MARDRRNVLEALLDGVVVIDVRGEVEQLNAEACRILEISPDSVTGRSVEDIRGEGHAVARLAREVLASGRSAVASEQPVERPRDADLVVDVAASPLFDDDGAVSGAAIVLRDRTMHHSLREAVAERERQELFGRIAAGIAHEVKNPLGGIRGAAEILGARAAEARSREAAQLIVREVERISRLVEDFMGLARGDELRLAEINLHQVLVEVLALLGHDPLATGTTVVRSFDPSIPELLADRQRLTQVFLNLARNAFEAMEAEGGTLTVGTRLVFDQHHSLPEGGRVPLVAVEFSDTGPGIPPEAMDQVATPFFTTRKSGSGLGLPLAEHWVTRHGGRMRIESAPGQGATVRVLLPLRRRP